MKGAIRTAVLAGVCAAMAAGASIPALASGGEGIDDRGSGVAPDPEPAPMTAADRKIEILNLKLKAEDLKTSAAALLGAEMSEDGKKALREVLISLDRIYSILEDMLQND